MKSHRISIILAAAIALPAIAHADDNLERALEAYERTHYAESVKLLRPAAEGGDLRAQEMLGFMHLYGATLYGSEVPRDLDQAQYWLQRAAAAGSLVATYGLRWVKKQAPLSDASTAARPRLE